MKLLWRSWIPCWWLWTAWSMWENWEVCIIISCVSSHRHQIDEWEPHEEQGLTSEPKKLSECRKMTIPSHHPVVDCTDYYETNLPVLEIFQTAQLPRIILPSPPKKHGFCVFLVHFHHQKTQSIHVFLPPKTFSKSTRLSATSGTTKLARRAGANAGVNVRKLPWAPKDLDLQVENTEKKHKYLDSLKEVGKKLIPQMVLNSDLPWLNQYKNTTKKITYL